VPAPLDLSCRFCGALLVGAALFDSLQIPEYDASGQRRRRQPLPSFASQFAESRRVDRRLIWQVRLPREALRPSSRLLHFLAANAFKVIRDG
jgi:hypothetical protein